MPAHQRIFMLRNGQTGGFTATFTVGGTQRQCGLFVRGLQGAETAAIEMLTTPERDETDAQAGDWMTVQVDGLPVRMTATDNLRSFLVPGIYRINCAAAAGPITAGVYF